MKCIASLFFCVWAMWAKGQHLDLSGISIKEDDSLLLQRIYRIEAQDTLFNSNGEDNSSLLGCIPLIFDYQTGENWFEHYEQSVKAFYFNDTISISRDLPFLQLSYTEIMHYDLMEKPVFYSCKIDYYQSPLSGHLIELNCFYIEQKPAFIIALSFINNRELCSWIHINLQQ